MAFTPETSRDVESLGITLMPDGGSIALRSTETVTGPCAAILQSFKGGTYNLDNGTKLNREYGGDSATLSASGFPVPIPLPETAVPEADGDFLMADKMGTIKVGDRLVDTYVGVWKLPATTLVRAFQTEEDRAVGRPQTIFASRQPIRSITYFPSPDSPSGTLNVVMDAGKGAARAIEMGWQHPGLFKPDN
ncbi:hypothetical protein [Sphingomonas qomolangmaensis]|uniref:Uncharacterized protein n=1 Tax=Sphingomonas qomolangmaensis TaxID=2918765 RepID=A0ABY5L9W9_9SPHN|nr:hypothetical protein [Sphingomonas qomolangmaensis]UUL82575.1 hypothetical protein NMP03_15615 [Sphingomonas qomolangmaensis]